MREMGEAVEVSVIIPCFNGSNVIRAQLEALSTERVSWPWEVVIADNGSSDDSTAVCAAYAGRLFLRLIDASDRRGQAHARNVGARHALGRKLIFLDQDDVISHGYVDHMAAALRQHDFVAASMDHKELNPPWAVESRAFAAERGLRSGLFPWAYGCVLGINRRLFEGVGGFDEDLPCAEDVDLCWRIQRDAGAELFHVREALLRYRLKTSRRDLFFQGMLYGRGGAALYRRWGPAGMSRRSLVDVARSWAAILRRLATTRDRGRRAQAWYLLGNRIGCVMGSIRERVVFL